MVLQRGYTCETLMSTFDPTLKSTLRYVQHSTQHKPIYLVVENDQSVSHTGTPALIFALFGTIQLRAHTLLISGGP